MSKTRQIAAVILAAGQGTRMKSALPKVLHRLAGKPMIGHVADAVAPLKPARTIVVTSAGNERVAAAVPGAIAAVQDPPRGTGDAVRAARRALRGFDGDVLVLYGDVPLIRPETLQAMVKALRSRKAPAVVVLGFRPADPAAYGRLVTNGDGTLAAIVEFKDADEQQRRIGLCNAGLMAISGQWLAKLLAGLSDDNAQKEYLLTDVVAIARAKGQSCIVIEAAEAEVMGINSRAELAAGEAALQDRLRRHWLAEGVTMTDPSTVFLSADTRLARDVVIEPNVVFAPGVAVGEGATIRAFSHLEGASVGPGAIIGPYARLRPGAVLAADVHVGNFVEIKNVVVAEGAKVNHLTYLGDGSVGAGANIGAGTITCNYDGYDKHRTEIGAGAFIGSNSSLVAPVRIGAGAITGAGSVVTRDVPDGALVVERSPAVVKAGWATDFRARKQARKSAKTKNG